MAHTGSQACDQLTLPLAQRWSRDLGAPVSYALVAGGRVFVTIGASGLTGHTALVALDEATGATLWGPITLGGTYWWATAAYDSGRVSAVNVDGLMTAFAAADGHILWSHQMPGQYAFSSAPTASGGTVYVGGAGSGGTVYAVDETDGGVRWTASVMNGDDSSPALGLGNVYVSYACNQAYAFDAATGAPLWHHSGSCEGGGGKTTALNRGRVYTRDFDGDLVLDADSGVQDDSYTSTYIPAFSATSAYYTTTTVKAVELDGGTLDWTFDAGATTIQTAPIVVGPHVVFGSSDGHVWVVDSTTGVIVSSAALSNIRPPDEQNVAAPLAGFTAADGMLFVPAGNSIVAY
ncbi:MAG: PQQ-binding-like beta-propeller repeat protein [Myxococcales bacterium]